MTNLSSSAMLVSLAVSQWTARKYDRRETADLAIRNGTPTEVARVNKSLLPFSSPLESIHKKTNEIRTEYYKRSLPWGMHGVNIIRSDAYMEFCSVVSPMLHDWRSLVASFVQQYPQLRDDAKIMLGRLYDENDYPDPSTIARRFSIDVIFSPVPDQGDWRVSLSDQEMEKLKAGIEARTQDAMGVAMKEAWKRVYDVVSHAQEKLVKPDAIFRDTLVSNALDLCKLLPALNIADDPDLERLRMAVEKSLCSHDPGTLREDPLVRSKAAAELDAIMQKMSAFYSPE